MHLRELRASIGLEKGVFANIICVFRAIVVKTATDVYAVLERIKMGKLDD